MAIPALDKSFVTGKLGPMPVWAWMLCGLGAALAYSSWNKNKTTNKKQQAAQTPADPNDPYAALPGNQRPPVVWQNYNTTLNTINNSPPGSGREHPPVITPPPTVAPPWRPWPIETPGPAPAPAPAPAPPPPAPPSGTWVTVARWGNPAPWNSSMWGIAQHFGRGSAGSNWQSIWNDPQNASLRSRRDVPQRIQPGDQVWVPA